MSRALITALACFALFACDRPKPESQAKHQGGPSDPPSTREAPASPTRTDRDASGAGRDSAARVLLVDHKASKIGFAVSRAPTGHIASFARFEARLDFTDQRPRQLEIELKTASVAADRAGLSAHLMSPDFFDVDKFPTSTFTTERITALPYDADPYRYEIEGTMRLHGVERKLKFPATIEISPEQVRGTATLDISAKAFGINYEGMEAELAQDAVSLEIELVFPRVAAP